jgi:DNA-binding transcriptional ArsR family regulator
VAEAIGREAKRGDVSFQPMRSWAFITTHARVLLAVAQNPELRVQEIAEAARITGRSAYRILADLVGAGYLRRTRAGRRNRYELDPDLPIGDPTVEGHTVNDLLSLIDD